MSSSKRKGRRTVAGASSVPTTSPTHIMSRIRGPVLAIVLWTLFAAVASHFLIAKQDVQVRFDGVLRPGLRAENEIVFDSSTVNLLSVDSAQELRVSGLFISRWEFFERAAIDVIVPAYPATYPGSSTVFLTDRSGQAIPLDLSLQASDIAARTAATVERLRIAEPRAGPQPIFAISRVDNDGRLHPIRVLSNTPSVGMGLQMDFANLQVSLGGPSMRLRGTTAPDSTRLECRIYLGHWNEPNADTSAVVSLVAAGLIMRSAALGDWLDADGQPLTPNMKADAAMIVAGREIAGCWVPPESGGLEIVAANSVTTLEGTSWRSTTVESTDGTLSIGADLMDIVAGRLEMSGCVNWTGYSLTNRIVLESCETTGETVLNGVSVQPRRYDDLPDSIIAGILTCFGVVYGWLLSRVWQSVRSRSGE